MDAIPLIHISMKKNNRTVIYRLIGRENQDEVQQKEDLKVFAQASNLVIVDEFVDNFLPWQQENRHQLSRLMDAARNQEFDCLLVWKLDCFACSLAHLCEVLQEFSTLETRFISIQDNMDFRGEMSLSAIHVLKKMMEFKSALIKERVKEGMAKAQEKGRIMGRPSTNAQFVQLIEELAAHTDYSIKKISVLTGNSISYSVIGKIVKQVRDKSKLT